MSLERSLFVGFRLADYFLWKVDRVISNWCCSYQANRCSLGTTTEIHLPKVRTDANITKLLRGNAISQPEISQTGATARLLQMSRVWKRKAYYWHLTWRRFMTSRTMATCCTEKITTSTLAFITSIEVGWIISHIRVAPRQTGKWGRGRRRIARDRPDWTSVLQQAPDKLPGRFTENRSQHCRGSACDSYD